MGKLPIVIRFVFIWLILYLLLMVPNGVLVEAEEEKKKRPQASKELTLPNNVISITKENTFPNPSDDATVVEPSDLARQLINEASETIENPELVKLLNESTIKTTPLTFGYEAEIFLGRWPLRYESESSSIIWDYKHVNTNELNNRGQEQGKKLMYRQEKEETVKGALMNQVEQPEMIKTLMLQKTKERAPFSLAFTTKVGANTKLNNVYNVGPKKVGVLQAYVPAVNEKGQIIFGDVYLHTKGSDIQLVIKNVTKQSIGAWIPIQDHISLTYTIK